MNNDNVLSSDRLWFAMIPGGMGLFAMKEAHRLPLGSLRMKVRQLKVLGYKPVAIPWFRYVRLIPADRLMYLRWMLQAEGFPKKLANSL